MSAGRSEGDVVDDRAERDGSDKTEEIDDAIRVEAAAIEAGAGRNPLKIRKLLGG